MTLATTSKISTALLTVLLVACSEPPQAPPDSADNAQSARAVEPRPPGLVAENAAWEQVARGFVYTDSPVALAADELLFAAPIQNEIYRLDGAGETRLFDQQTEHTMGLVMGSDGLIYGCRNQGAAIVRYALDGGHETLLQGKLTEHPDDPNAPGEFCNDVAVAANGNLWFSDRLQRQIVLLRPDGTSSAVASGFRSNGIVLSADGQILVATDSVEPRLRAFTIASDGSLDERPGFFPPVKTMKTLAGGRTDIEGRPGTNGMTVDRDGRYYVSSFYGIQVFAADGSYIGVIDKPKGFVSNLVFAGAGRDWLYATGTNGVWRLAMQVTGAER